MTSSRWLLSLWLAVACHKLKQTGGDDVAAPIIATPGAWSFVSFPDAVCDDGSATGIGVNPSASGSANLLIYFAGGGFCWDYATCTAVDTSVHGPFGITQFNGVDPSGSILDRALPDSSFADWNLVYVPYCTDDWHGGNNVQTYVSGSKSKTFHHEGHSNFMAYLERLKATYLSPAKVVVAGSDAGGFGAVLNYDSAREAWPLAEGYLLDDSGPFLPGNASLYSQVATSWNLSALLDPLCGSSCAGDPSLLYTKLTAKYPTDRLSLISYEQDAVASAQFMLSQSAFQGGLLELTKGLPFKLFVVSGDGHSTLIDPAPVNQNGIQLLEFIQQQVTDSNTWTSVLAP